MILSIFIPTFGRAEFLRALIARLAVEIDGFPDGNIELVVSDNCSFDHTAEVLGRAIVLYPWLKIVRPPQHLISAEENVFFALSHCCGDFVWGLGDDDDIADGAVARIMSLLSEPQQFDLLFINAATMNVTGRTTRTRLVTMNADRIWWPAYRIVAAIGLMGLSACLTAVVARREILMRARWDEHLERSCIYAHVISYLDAFRFSRCLLLNEALVIARQGATGLAEFTRFSQSAGRYLYWPWTVGLPRHLGWLLKDGAIPADFAARALEPQGEEVQRLLPYLLRGISRHLDLWLRQGGAFFAYDEDDFENLTMLGAAASRSERETIRGLVAVGQVIASLTGRPGALPATSAIALMDKQAAETVRAAVREASKDDNTLLVSQTLLGGRNEMPSEGGTAGQRDPVTLFQLLGQLSPEARATLQADIVSSLSTALHALAVRSAIDAVHADGDAFDGFRELALGAVYVALIDGRVLTGLDMANLRAVDPREDPPHIVIAEGRKALASRLEVLAPILREQPRFDETFLGWDLGLWRGRQHARLQGDLGETTLSSSVDRQHLRRLVCRARRDTAACLHSVLAAAIEVRPATLEDRNEVEKRALFDDAWYLSRYPASSLAVDRGVVVDPLEHWLRLGGRYGLDPNPWFDTDDYFAENPDAAEAVALGVDATALHHYLRCGAAKGARPFAVFDPLYYLSLYPDAAAAASAGVTALEHFLKIGLLENRNVSEAFKPSAYLAANPDVAEAVAAGHTASALVHYVQHGRSEGRRLSTSQ